MRQAVVVVLSSCPSNGWCGSEVRRCALNLGAGKMNQLKGDLAYFDGLFFRRKPKAIEAANMIVIPAAACLIVLGSIPGITT